MTWCALLDLIADELGAEAAARVARRAQDQLAGVRITISPRRSLSKRRVNAAALGRPKEAARVLGVHPVTVYRVLHRAKVIR